MEECVARMASVRNSYTNLVGKILKDCRLKISNPTWEGIIKMGLK